ncbi:MAG: hypothetical protein PHF74_08540 [Dehalococcoidales bacterium]|nr:hypothetical protein [Dehalococcoidales bacterium]
MSTLLSRPRNRFNKNRTFLKLLVILAAVGIMMILSVSCDSSYEKYTLNKDDVSYLVPGDLVYELKFTLEYPIVYTMMLANSSKSACSVMFIRDYPEGLFPEMIEIIVQKPSYSGRADSTAYLYDRVAENITSPDDNNTQIEDVRLVENREVIVDGISGLYTAYSYQWIKFGTELPAPREATVRHAFFNHAGYDWILSMSAWGENTEETEVYFNHLLKTFKFQE